MTLNNIKPKQLCQDQSINYAKQVIHQYPQSTDIDFLLKQAMISSKGSCNPECLKNALNEIINNTIK